MAKVCVRCNMEIKDFGMILKMKAKYRQYLKNKAKDNVIYFAPRTLETSLEKRKTGEGLIGNFRDIKIKGNLHFCQDCFDSFGIWVGEVGVAE